MMYNENLNMIACNKVPLSKDRENQIYISGKMTGLPNYNFETFNAKELELREEGWDVCNPASHGLVEGAVREDYLRYDGAQLMSCSTIYMLSGWEDSEGAKWEFELAKFLGMKVIYEESISV